MYVLAPDKNTGMKPIKCWATNLEDVALEQAENLARLPFVYRHVALMPDAHMGYGMPIGGVIGTKNVIIPNAVGVDIGCGMCACKIDTAYYPKDKLKEAMGLIRKAVPVGFNHHKEDQYWGGFEKAPELYTEIVRRHLTAARKQIGTLGGGNHFIELQRDERDQLWIMIHSGSRNVGLKIAKHYHDEAKKLCEKWHSNIPCQDLAFLPIDSPEGRGYKLSMDFALNFAKANRRHMMNQCLSIIDEVFDPPHVNEEKILDVHHNYAAVENHFGENLWVHRKGATSAREGQLGIIPGSQGTKSYIVEGLGNPESFMSCSHGAGRTMGRKAAQKELDLEEQKKILDDQGIVHGIRHQKDLDEAPGAYKDIDEVMNNQTDLVKIVHTLTPLGVIKG